jgi:uncharacterized protein YjbI with pentapeptide repeats
VANEEHLAKLKEGVEGWNAWREVNEGVQLDLTNADFSGTDLSCADLSWVNLRGADLSAAKFHAADLSDADLSDVNLSGAELHGAVLNRAKLPNANLKGAILDRASLHQVNLINANLIRASLEETDLTESHLVDAQLNGANLRKAVLVDVLLSSSNLTNANLTAANLTRANLVMASLIRAQFTNACLRSTDLTRVSAGEADFSGAELTGACIQEWGIGFSTKLNNLTCSYIYLRNNREERRPSDPNKHFLLGEFNALIQQSLYTVDLIFVDGIDWKAFFLSFQELRSQYDENLSIQAIEKKSGGVFVIRLEVPPEVDKAAIESRAKELYGEKLRFLEERVSDYKDEVRSLRHSNTNLEKILETMANNQPTNQTTIQGNVNGFVQSGSGTVSHFSQAIGQNSDDIVHLLTALQEQAQQFPDDQRDDAFICLDGFRQDLSTPEKREPNRIKRRIVALLTIAGVVAAPIATATDFVNNVFELADKVGIPKSELLQHVPTDLLPPHNQL